MLAFMADVKYLRRGMQGIIVKCELCIARDYHQIVATVLSLSYTSGYCSSQVINFPLL